MAIKTSDGFEYHINVSGSTLDAFDTAGYGLLLKVYGGPVPSSPNDALGAATLLVVYSLEGAGSGLSLEAHATDKRTLIKPSGATWQGTAVATGLATFYRLVRHSGDDGTASTTQQRIQGSVGNRPTDDLYLSNPQITAGETRVLSAYALTRPNAA